VFELYRRQGDRETVVGRVAGTAADRYAYLDRNEAVDSSATYSIAARAPNGAWEWRGPLRPD
jgi:hypothetical protein